MFPVFWWTSGEIRQELPTPLPHANKQLGGGLTHDWILRSFVSELAKMLWTKRNVFCLPSERSQVQPWNWSNKAPILGTPFMYNTEVWNGIKMAKILLLTYACISQMMQGWIPASEKANAHIPHHQLAVCFGRNAGIDFLTSSNLPLKCMLFYWNQHM